MKRGSQRIEGKQDDFVFQERDKILEVCLGKLKHTFFSIWKEEMPYI